MPSIASTASRINRERIMTKMENFVLKRKEMLYEHQKKIIAEDPKKTGLFLGTGSGKTRTALMLARGRTLVICPKTTKEDETWEREYEKLDKIIPVDYWKKITTISKETFRRDAHKLLRFDTVIVDEAETCLGVTPNIRWVKKQPIPRASQLFEALLGFVARTKPERLYLCTATIARSPMTVWGASKILGKNWNFYQWRDAFYFRLPMPGREVFTAKNDDEAKDRLAKAIRSLGYVGRLEEFFDVPEQTYKTIHLELTAKQKARIRELSLEYPEPIVLLGKKLQVENGILSGDEFNAPEYFDNAKIDKILDLAIEFPKMVIFARYRAQIDSIYFALKGEGYKVLVITGDTKDRGEMLKEANASKACILLVSAQISAGWEAPDYPCMVFASRTYSYTDYQQGLGRIQRANNIKKNLYINLVVKGGIDEAVDKCLTVKKSFDERIYLKL